MNAPETYLTPEVLAFVGTRTEPTPPITIGELGARRFAEATGDNNPIYLDREAARAAGYRTVVVPPTAIGQNLPGWRLPDPPLAIERQSGVVGSWSWEFHAPLLADESVTAVCEVVGITEKSGRLGLMVFVEYEYTFTRADDGALVAKSRMTRVRY